ncbi:heterokaryon incompatibility protein-domain-containing protein [Bisporella sp. PMI_857]|nr:heterokaryon incompatibility protein-domain-containing protein [Bisporella sp. PMI_857]
MESQQHDTYQADIDVAISGSALLELASKDSHDGRRKLFEYEKQLLEDSFAVGQRDPNFRGTYVNALRLALKTNNHDVVELLLKKDTAHDVFKDESDILQVAISASAGRWRAEPSHLKARIETLITYGASVNAFDDEGKSPLYYSCVKGVPDTFKFLIESGADCSALFDPFPSGEIDNPPSPDTEGLGKANLLQIALNARQENERWGTVPSIWEKGPMRWDSIVMYLLNAGLYCRPDDPSLVKFLHVVCYQGDLTAVEKLLDYGVDYTARAGRSDNRDYVFGSALHVAAAMGQKDIAVCLLKHGADPREKYSCTRSLLREEFMMTPVESVFKLRPMSLHQMPDEQKILEVCEILVEHSADEQDGQFLLEGCVKAGNGEMAKKLLEKGFRIQEIPICSHLEVVRLLLDYGCQIDTVKFQRHAVGSGSVDLLCFLVNRDGPLLPQGDFGSIAFQVMRGNHLGMLRYLVTEYGFDINGIFPGHPGATSRINLLQRACDEGCLNSVALLLELGADVDCPGLPDTALNHFRKQLRQQSRGFNYVLTQLPMIRLLLRYLPEKSEDWVVINSMKAADAGGKPKLLQVKNKFFNPKGTKSLDTIVQSRESPQCTAERGDSGSGEQELKSTVTISWQKPYAESQRLLRKRKDEAFAYRPLDPMQNIRVLELEPSKSIDEPIRGRLVLMYLPQKPHYEALSYTRGDQSKVAGILLEDVVFEVTQNLWLALRRLRYKDKPRLLWIDALCIDQENIQERNQQVSIMRDIYQMANQTIFWVGEEGDDSHLVFEHLREWKEYCEDYKAGRVKSRDPMFNESHINPPSYKGKTRDAFLKLCQRPLFFRSWVIQEVSLAKSAIVMCGPDTESIRLLGLPSSFGTTVHPLQAINGPSHYHNLTSIGRPSGLHGLGKVIQCSRFCEASDPRDKVYSLLGMFDHQIIPVDYSLSVADVYRQFTQAVVEETKSLQVLHWMGTQRERDDLNSWVQDFSVSKPAGVLPGIFGSWTHGLNYPLRTLPGLQFCASEFLIKGKYIESIQCIGPELHANVDNILGSDSFAETLYHWESLAAKLVSQKRFKNAVTGAFLDTLIANDRHWTVANGKAPEFSFHAEAFATFYERYGTGILAEADLDYFRDIAFIQEWSEEGNADKMNEWKVSHFTQSMEIACYGRSFFITDQGSMGLAPPRAKPEDELVYFPGGLYPFVVRMHEEGAYELIGDCFLYDFDVYKLFDDESKQIKDFVLR